MEIQVGEYVKSTDGFIAKVEEIDEDFIDFDSPIIIGYDGLCSYFGRDQLHFISKHSFNIIDLIEIEDLVNVIDGDTTAVCEVIGTGIRDKNFKKTNEIGVRYMSDEMDIIPLKRIKSIVTKEQFKAMEYEVK